MKTDDFDYKLMEDYSRNLLEAKKEKYLNYNNKKLADLEYKEIEPLENKEWKEFFIEDLFDVTIGKNIDGNKINKTSGYTPYITRKETNNGLDGFISYDSFYKNISYPVITIGNETAYPFVQSSPFFTGTKVNIMKLKSDCSDRVLFFISESIKQQRKKYSYSYTINSTRLKRQMIKLPVIPEGQPDYEYMEQYIKNIEYKKRMQYKKYSSNYKG